MLKRYALLLCTLMLFLPALQPVLAHSESSFNPQALDDYLKQQVSANHLPGLAVAVVQDDQVVFVKGYGEAAPGVPVSGQTQFYIGSLTKSLTALAVMQLVEQGKVELDAPVQRYLSWFSLADAKAAARITVRHLLNQTSGLGDGSDPGVSDFTYADSTAEQVRGLADAQLKTAPGEQYQYYNGNYQILGLVIEQASGQPYAEYLRDQVFSPLDMQSSVTDPIAATNMARGNGIAFGLPFPRSQTFRASALPSGYVISTAEDLAHFMIAELNQGRYAAQQVLGPDALALTHTPPEEIGSTYAMGWLAFDDPAYGRVLYHDGALENYNTQMILLPDRHMGLVAMTNQGGLMRQLTFNPAVTSGMADILGGNPAKPVSYAWVGWVLAGLFLLDMASHAYQFSRLPNWQRKTAARPPRARWLRALPALVLPFVLLAGILLVLSSAAGGFSAMALLPDIAAWVILGLSLALVRGAVKVWLVWRAGQRANADIA